MVGGGGGGEEEDGIVRIVHLPLLMLFLFASGEY